MAPGPLWNRWFEPKSGFLKLLQNFSWVVSGSIPLGCAPMFLDKKCCLLDQLHISHSLVTETLLSCTWKRIKWQVFWSCFGAVLTQFEGTLFMQFQGTLPCNFFPELTFWGVFELFLGVSKLFGVFGSCFEVFPSCFQAANAPIMTSQKGVFGVHFGRKQVYARFFRTLLQKMTFPHILIQQQDTLWDQSTRV